MAKSKSLKYLENKIFPFQLNEAYKSKFNILNDKYDDECLIKSIDIGYSKYIILDTESIPTSSSVNEFLSKLGGIAYNISLPPIDKQINYIKNVCKKKYTYWDDLKAQSIMNKYVNALRDWKWSEENILYDLENETFIKSKECRSWTQWINLIEGWTDSIYNQISNKKIEIKENSLITFNKKYSILNQIGFGSFGITYLCHEEKLNKKFVIKEFLCERLDENENRAFFEKFKYEIDILFDLHHQNIVNIYDYYFNEEDQKTFYVMEYIDGGNIEEYLSNNPDKFNDIFNQLITVFSYLENKKICHRDIRISNLMVNKYGELKLIDFGFVKNIENSFSINTITKLVRYPYSIPEELNNKKPKYDNKTEIFFIGQLYKDLIERIKPVNFKYQQIVDKMISYSRRDRFNSFKSIKSKL